MNWPYPHPSRGSCVPGCPKFGTCHCSPGCTKRPSLASSSWQQAGRVAGFPRIFVREHPSPHAGRKPGCGQARGTGHDRRSCPNCIEESRRERAAYFRAYRQRPAARRREKARRARKRREQRKETVWVPVTLARAQLVPLVETYAPEQTVHEQKASHPGLPGTAKRYADRFGIDRQSAQRVLARILKAEKGRVPLDTYDRIVTLRRSA